MPQVIAAAVTYVAGALAAVGVPAVIAKAIAFVAVNLAVTVAMNAAVTAMTPDPDPGGRLLNASQFTELTADPLSDRVIIYGETGIAGEVVFQQLHSNGVEVNFVIEIADAAQQGHDLVKALFDGTQINFDSNGNAIGALHDYLFLRFYDGSQTTADAQLVTESGGLWTAGHVGRSCCYVIMKPQIGSVDNKFPNGRPDPIFVIKGRRVYDPRLDSTKPGGSGAHRIGDESTWEWSNNAALCAYDYARGIFVTTSGGAKVRVAGLGLPVDLIDEDWVVASANACDEEGWTIDGAFVAGSDPADVLKSFAVHMGGRIATRKGKLAIIAGYDWPTVGSIEEDDLAGRVKIKHAKEWRDVHNAIKAAYRDEAARYEGVETKLVKVDSWIAQDNGEKFERTISLPFVTDRVKATRLAKLDLYRKRAPRTIDVPVKLKKARFIEGDFVEVELPSYGIEETYEVIGWTLDQSGFAQLRLELWDAAGLEWSDEEAGDPPDWDTLQRGTLIPDAPDTEDWEIAPSTVKDHLPALEITGSAPGWIDSLLIDYRQSDETGWTSFGTLPPAMSQFKLSLGPDQEYDVSIRYRYRERISERLILTETTPDILLALEAAYSETSDIADSIVGQGDLATTNRAALPFGENQAINSEFKSPGTYPPKGWQTSSFNASPGPSLSLISTGARSVVQAAITGTPTSGQVFGCVMTPRSLANLKRYALPVMQGDRVVASFYGAHNSSVSGFYIGIDWYDASGSFLSPSYSAVDVTKVADGSTGNPDNFSRQYVVATAPANARFATQGHGFRCNGGANPSAWMIKPMLALLPADQTAVPEYSPGSPDRLSDATTENIAAGVSGQGSLATMTPPSYAGNSAAYAALGIGQLFTDTSDGNKIKATITPEVASGFAVSLNRVASVKSRSGLGTLASDPFTATPSGGSGSYAYQWAYFSGDALHAGGTSTTASMTATHNFDGFGQSKATKIMLTVTDTGTGQTITKMVSYFASENS